jgi:ligand-binding sensor domain-containing protein/signal transduction histidine kinase
MLGACFLIGGKPGMSQEVSFTHYGVQDGISQSQINCIFQDSEGFIWFGTQNGLNKFDGYTVERFFHNPGDSYSLSSSWIFGIAEDSLGYLWIATKAGLNQYNRATGHFTVFPHRIPGDPVRDDFVYGITADDSCLYLNIPPVLSILNYRTWRLTSHTNDYPYEGSLYDIGYPILRTKDGLIWIGSLHGLGSFDPVHKRFINFRHDTGNPASLSSDRVTALHEDRHGNLLVGTENGLNRLDPRTGRFTRWYSQNTANSLSNSFIRSICQDRSGTYWIGTEAGGLNKMILNDRWAATFMHFRSQAEGPNSISHDIIYSLFEDRSRNLWIGTIAGIDKMDLKRKKFMHFKRSADPGSIRLLDNVIGSIYQDDQGRLWIGNWNKGLNIVDPRTGKVEYYTAELPGKNHIPGNNVHVIYRDSKSRIWLGTRNGVCLYDNSTGRFRLFQDYFGIPVTDYFTNNRVYCIVEDTTGKIWMGTGNGIFLLDIGKKSFRLIQAGNPDPEQSISSNLVYSLLEDREGYVWIATSNGVDRYEPEKGRITHYTRDPSSTNTLSDNYTISLCEDAAGNIWIGTGSGVNRFNKADSTFTQYTMNEGLPSNIIYNILEDDQHDLWFSTGNGLARCDPESGDIRSYTLEEGVYGMEFNIKAIFKGKDGELFFGGMDGFISFYPDSLLSNQYIPPVKITSFEKENNGVRTRLLLNTPEINLTYRDYSFTVAFSALDYSDPSKNQYAYQLEPLSDKWIEIGNRRFVHFTNLPPGKYYFRVRGTNNDGYWNMLGTGLYINIAPPWWKSRVAYIFYLLFLVTSIMLVIWWRGKKLVQEKRVLEEKVRDRTEEIMRQKNKLDELNTTKDKFFSILAHDLKGPFSSLYAVSELLNVNYDTLEETDKRTGLSKIHKSADLIYKLLDNLLVWARSQRGGMVFTPVRFNLAKAVEVNVNLHRPLAAEKGVEIRNTAAKDIFAWGDLEMIDTVLRNLINNAVKFSHRGSTVEVAIKEEQNFLEVFISDQGIGISAENLKKLFRIDVKYKTTGTAGETGTGLGLILCREFVEQNGGTVWCESLENSGTTFHFTLPRPDGIPAGNHGG